MFTLTFLVILTFLNAAFAFCDGTGNTPIRRLATTTTALTLFHLFFIFFLHSETLFAEDASRILFSV